MHKFDILQFMRVKLSIWLVVAILLAAACKKEEGGSACKEVPTSLASVLPEIEPFMIDTGRISPATWLGRPQPDGRLIQEPINLIVLDEKATSEASAEARLTAAFTKAGFAPRYGHSSGYWGKMNGDLYAQQPSVRDFAFSDYMWVFTNNHARMFGPYIHEGIYVWIGSSSRERGIAHDYVSFRISRDAMVKEMVNYGAADDAGCYFLNNKIDNANVSTGDHDGFAGVLVLK
jgi:hypothetical protein